MSGSNPAPNDLPPHIEESVGSIARLHAEHHDSATPGERAIESMTTVLERATSVAALAVALAVWAGGNILAGVFGYKPIDPPPFIGLISAVSVVSLFLVILILAAERRANALS